MATLTIPMPKREQERLTRLALRYGLSLADFSRKILAEITSEIPDESFKDYQNPKALRTSFLRALRDWKRGRVRDRL